MKMEGWKRVGEIPATQNSKDFLLTLVLLVLYFIYAAWLRFVIGMDITDILRSRFIPDMIFFCGWAYDSDSHSRILSLGGSPDIWTFGEGFHSYFSRVSPLQYSRPDGLLAFRLDSGDARHCPYHFAVNHLILGFALDFPKLDGCVYAWNVKNVRLQW